MKFSIVTPSYRSGRWLKLCIPSVADQEGVEFEHIVQDSCSDDETRDWLPGDSRVTAVIEKDGGMYDAVNRGFRRATGDILAYLNCDEQYLPGTLAKVTGYFVNHPDVDALLGDCIVVDANGNYLCERRALVPQLYQTQVGTTLSFLTAALFLRRRVIADSGLFFDPHWRVIGDSEWTVRALQARLRFGILREFTSTFTNSGDNLSFVPSARNEGYELHSAAPSWVRATAPFWTAHYRLRRFFGGCYSCKPHDYAIYTAESPEKRRTFHVARPTFVWKR